MNFNITKQEALNILLLNENYTEKELKKSYYKKALLYHPDKNKNNIELFKKINEAYQLLNYELNNIKIDNNISNNNYSAIFKEFINSYFKDYINKENANIVFDFVNIINKQMENIENINNVENITNIIKNMKSLILNMDFELIKKNINIIQEIISFFIKNKDLFQQNNEIIENIKNILNTKFKKNVMNNNSNQNYNNNLNNNNLNNDNLNNNVIYSKTNKLNETNKINENKYSEMIILKPSLYEIYNEKIYVYVINNELPNNDLPNNELNQNYKTIENKIFVPLWLDEIEITKKCIINNNYRHFIIHIQPELPSNISIDENNNIHIYKNYNLRDLYNNEFIYIDELKKENNNNLLKIKTSDLFIRKYQTYVIKNNGIPIINDINIYDNTNKSNIILHIFIE